MSSEGFNSGRRCPSPLTVLIWGKAVSLGPGAPSTNIPMDVYSRSAEPPERCRPRAARCGRGVARGRGAKRSTAPPAAPSPPSPPRGTPVEDPRLSHRTAREERGRPRAEQRLPSVRSSAPSLFLCPLSRCCAALCCHLPTYLFPRRTETRPRQDSIDLLIRSKATHPNGQVRLAVSN